MPSFFRCHGSFRAGIAVKFRFFVDVLLLGQVDFIVAMLDYPAVTIVEQLPQAIMVDIHTKPHWSNPATRGSINIGRCPSIPKRTGSWFFPYFFGNLCCKWGQPGQIQCVKNLNILRTQKRCLVTTTWNGGNLTIKVSLPKICPVSHQFGAPLNHRLRVWTTSLPAKWSVTNSRWNQKFTTRWWFQPTQLKKKMCAGQKWFNIFSHNFHGKKIQTVFEITTWTIARDMLPAEIRDEGNVSGGSYTTVWLGTPPKSNSHSNVTIWKGK